MTDRNKDEGFEAVPRGHGLPYRGPDHFAAKTKYRESVYGKRGGHYNLFTSNDDNAMELLRREFPDAIADKLNFVLFSTSGVHGSYSTIEEVERELQCMETGENPLPDVWSNADWQEVLDEGLYEPALTFLLVQPRIVSMTCGNCYPKTMDDIAFLKRLRQSSWDVVQMIGRKVAADG